GVATIDVLPAKRFGAAWQALQTKKVQRLKDKGIE
ncbi:hypothetical protein LCGC14_2657770, partial [marine sediment metagenome]